MTSHSLVPQSPALHLPVAQMRNVFHPGDVERKLARLQDAGSQREYENLRTVYERMLERGPERFHVKPSGVPDMSGLYELLPNFTDVLDDIKRHVALAQDSSDGLEVTPMLLLGPPRHRQNPFCKALGRPAGHRHEPAAHEFHDGRLAAFGLLLAMERRAPRQGV